MSAVLVADSPPLGLINSLSIEAYHAGPGISKSGLDLVARSPATYFAKHLDPNRPPERERAGQLEGSLAHCALLEPNEFEKRYAVVPAGAPRRPTDAQWNAKKPSEESLAAMTWWRTFNEWNAGKTIVTDDQRRVAHAQAAAMRALPCVRDALAGEFVTEQSAFAMHETGVLTRCRPDLTYRVPRGAILFDVKTFSSAAPDEFARQVARKRYHVQDAFYRDVYAAAAGVDVLGFVFVAVEPEYPFLANALMLDDESVDFGRRAYRRDLEAYGECVRTGAWPGYGDEIDLISLPRWLTRKDEEE